MVMIIVRTAGYMRAIDREAGSNNNKSGFYNNRWSTSYEWIQDRLSARKSLIFYLFELSLHYILVRAKWKRCLIQKY